MNKKLSNNTGQVAVEYVLLLFIIASLLFSLMGEVKKYILADQGNCTPASKSIVCKFDTMLSFNQFRRFRIMYRH